MEKAGIVLTGGGARAAYQVGVLRAISDMYPGSGYPFEVIIGTSAGAINALSIAGGGGIFRHSVSKLESLWSELTIDQIFYTGTYSILGNMTRVARKLMSGGHQSRTMALLNNAPLRKLLERELDFETVRETLDSGALRAVGVNACGYATGQNVCFFDSHGDIGSWSSGQRAGCRTELSLPHVLASSAIPTLFPPVQINREYFGDGVTRQMAHVSPALRLGAERVLVIGVSSNSMCSPKRPEHPGVPGFGQVMSHVFNGMFLDTLDYDIERLRVINQLLDMIPEKKLKQTGLDLKPVELLDISPSEPIEDIAKDYMDRLPSLLKPLTGVREEGDASGASLASYLLFDHAFSQELIRLGYSDAQSHAKQIERFFGYND